MLRQLVQAEICESKDVRHLPRIGAQITKEEIMMINATYLIYIDDKPFCVLYGTEQDAKDFVENRNATYEPFVTVMVQYGFGDSKKRGA